MNLKGTLTKLRSVHTSTGRPMAMCRITDHGCKTFDGLALILLANRYAYENSEQEVYGYLDSKRDTGNFAPEFVIKGFGKDPVDRSPARVTAQQAAHQPVDGSPQSTDTVLEGQIGGMRVVSDDGKRTKLLLTIAGRPCKAYGDTADRLRAKYKNGEYTHAEGSFETCRFGEEFVIKKGHRIQPPNNNVATAAAGGATVRQGTNISNAGQNP